MSDIFGAGSEDLDWTSDLGVSERFRLHIKIILAEVIVKRKQNRKDSEDYNGTGMLQIVTGNFKLMLSIHFPKLAGVVLRNKS